MNLRDGGRVAEEESGPVQIKRVGEEIEETEEIELAIIHFGENVAGFLVFGILEDKINFKRT